jgi:hypothetical protein
MRHCGMHLYCVYELVRLYFAAIELHQKATLGWAADLSSRAALAAAFMPVQALGSVTP